MTKIAVVLNGYKRLQHLENQIKYVKNSTIQPYEILLWQNGTDKIDDKLLEGVKHSQANINFGVWARFAYALNTKSDYVCVIDDDTVIGSKWFENCLKTLETHNGLLGTIGIKYHTNQGYFPSTRYGWANPNESTVEVDIVGHCWFFRREWLSYLWRELPDIDESPFVGEDIHFSHMLWKYGKIKTFVPPHPKNDTSQWGSLLEHNIGADAVATYHDSKNMSDMNKALLKAFKNGFVPIIYRGL